MAGQTEKLRDFVMPIDSGTRNRFALESNSLDYFLVSELNECADFKERAISNVLYDLRTAWECVGTPHASESEKPEFLNSNQWAVIQSYLNGELSHEFDVSSEIAFLDSFRLNADPLLRNLVAVMDSSNSMRPRDQKGEAEFFSTLIGHVALLEHAVDESLIDEKLLESLMDRENATILGRNRYFSLTMIREMLLNPTKAHDVLTYSGIALQHMPPELIRLEHCYTAIGSDAYSLSFVPGHILDAHPELYMRAVETWPATIELVPQEYLTLEMCEKALAADPSLAEVLPEEISTRLKAENFSPAP